MTEGAEQSMPVFVFGTWDSGDDWDVGVERVGFALLAALVTGVGWCFWLRFGWVNSTTNRWKGEEVFQFGGEIVE